MTLSRRANELLARATHHPHPGSGSDIEACIQRAGLPVFERIVDFEQRYGGLEYRIRCDRAWGLRLGLVPEWRGPGSLDLVLVRGERLGEHYLYECAVHPSAQSALSLDEQGTLYADNVPISSSICKYIESDAVLEELCNTGASMQLLFGTAPRDACDLRGLMETAGLSLIGEASDDYTSWWESGRFRVHQHVYWDGIGHTDRLVAYAASDDEERVVIEALRGTPYRSEPVRYRWPRIG